MAMLSDYTQFTGVHWETGTIHNALAYQGVKAPHSGQPISEALLLGISGGSTFGYFTFEYKGYLPHIVLLTRNTFDPLETLLNRLAIPRDVLQTTNPEKGEANLRSALESGHPAMVWADMFSLPYNQMPYDEGNWCVWPLLVYGYDKDLDDGHAYLADRAQCPIVIPVEVLQKARGRIGKNRLRVMTLDAPDWSLLPDAVRQGIQQSINLYTEAPPKGRRENFGLAALHYWAKMLTNTRNKQSWARYFAPGARMWMALVGDLTQAGAYGWIKLAPGNSAERGMYADFLQEAAIILDKPGLNEAAHGFRQSEVAWGKLADEMLPAHVPLLHEAATLLTRKRTLFREQGARAMDAIQAINARLSALQAEATTHFPISDADLPDFRAGLAHQVEAIHDIERDAIACLQAVMASD